MNRKRNSWTGNGFTGEMFVEITGRDGFDIHIRTKGTFNRHVRGIDRNGTVSFRKIKAAGLRTLPDAIRPCPPIWRSLQKKRANN